MHSKGYIFQFSSFYPKVFAYKVVTIAFVNDTLNLKVLSLGNTLRVNIVRELFFLRFLRR